MVKQRDVAEGMLAHSRAEALPCKKYTKTWRKLWEFETAEGAVDRILLFFDHIRNKWRWMKSFVKTAQKGWGNNQFSQEILTRMLGKFLQFAVTADNDYIKKHWDNITQCAYREGNNEFNRHFRGALIESLRSTVPASKTALFQSHKATSRNKPKRPKKSSSELQYEHLLTQYNTIKEPLPLSVPKTMKIPLPSNNSSPPLKGILKPHKS